MAVKRGGRFGLDTVTLDQDGTAVLYRLASSEDAWERATMKVPPEAVSKILAAVSENGLLRLHKEYRARNVYDGTQWVLRITQGENEKRVYFNNYFPGAITHFAESLDDILVESGVRQIRWEQVPETENRLHEKDLWSSVQR